MYKLPFRLLSIFLALFFVVSGNMSQQVYAGSYAVHYSVRGILEIRECVSCLYTADGRVFQLLMSGRAAEKFNGKTVAIDGKVEKSDETDTLKVKKIREIPAEKVEIEPVEHEEYQRPAKLAKDEKGLLRIDNVRWNIAQDPGAKEPKAQHSWESVTVDPAKVLKVFYVVKPFAPKFIAAHTLLAFTFASGGIVSDSGAESSTLVLSIEAYKKLGQTYGLMKTLKKEYDIVWILTTLRNYAELNINFNQSSDSELVVYPVLFDPQQTRSLLEETVRQACVNRQGEYYNTIRNNCTNNLVILLNRVLPEKRQIRLWAVPGMIYNPKATMPLSVVKKLQKKQIIGEPFITISRGNFSKTMSLFE
jgi:hypothetical protein